MFKLFWGSPTLTGALRIANQKELPFIGLARNPRCQPSAFWYPLCKCVHNKVLISQTNAKFMMTSWHRYAFALPVLCEGSPPTGDLWIPQGRWCGALKFSLLLYRTSWTKSWVVDETKWRSRGVTVVFYNDHPWCTTCILVGQSRDSTVLAGNVNHLPSSQAIN